MEVIKIGAYIAKKYLQKFLASVKPQKLQVPIIVSYKKKFVVEYEVIWQKSTSMKTPSNNSPNNEEKLSVEKCA